MLGLTFHCFRLQCSCMENHQSSCFWKQIHTVAKKIHIYITSLRKKSSCISLNLEFKKKRKNNCNYFLWYHVELKNITLLFLCLCSTLSHLLKLEKRFHFLLLGNKPSELSKYIWKVGFGYVKPNNNKGKPLQNWHQTNKITSTPKC